MSVCVTHGRRPWVGIVWRWGAVLFGAGGGVILVFALTPVICREPTHVLSDNFHPSMEDRTTTTPGESLTLLLADPLSLGVAHGGHVETTQPSTEIRRTSHTFTWTGKHFQNLMQMMCKKKRTGLRSVMKLLPTLRDVRPPA